MAAKMTAKIGTDMLIVVASAIGSRIIAPKLHAMPVRPISIRRACAPIRRVFSDHRPLVALPHASRTGTPSASPPHRLPPLSPSAAPPLLPPPPPPHRPTTATPPHPHPP